MIDGSKLEYNENVRVTCEIVKAAHALGIDVEAELGKVGIAANKGDFKNEDMYTTAEQAADFVAKTNVDSLGDCHRQRPRLVCRDAEAEHAAPEGNQ